MLVYFVIHNEKQLDTLACRFLCEEVAETELLILLFNINIL